MRRAGEDGQSAVFDVHDGRRLTRAILAGAVAEVCARDRDLGRVVERYGLPPLWARPAGFATLVRIVLEQQVSLASGRAAFERLAAGAGGVDPGRIANLSLPHLRRLGLTRQKAAYIRGIACAVASGAVDLRALARAGDAAVRTVLQGLRGVGPWTADIYLVMALRRPDVWPDGDLALVAALARVKRLRGVPSRDRAREIASAWAPWRSVAARILWHHYLSSGMGRRPDARVAMRRQVV